MTGERLPAWQADRLATLLDACGGISVGAAERESLSWLAGFELATVERIASVMRRLTKRAEVLGRRANAARDEAISRHLEADRYRGQLEDLCEWAGIEAEDDPHASLVAHLKSREQADEKLLSTFAAWRADVDAAPIPEPGENLGGRP